MLHKTQRITKRSKTGVASTFWKDGMSCYKEDFCPPPGQECNAHACDLAIAIERLAAYEDTRMFPEDVVAMKKEVKQLRAKVKELKAQLAELTSAAE